MHDHHRHRHAEMNVLPEQAVAHRIEMSEKPLLKRLRPLQAPKIGETKRADHHLRHHELIA
jgi:hypothetical protein